MQVDGQSDEPLGCCDAAAALLHRLHAVSAAGLAQWTVQLSPMRFQSRRSAIHTARRPAVLQEMLRGLVRQHVCRLQDTDYHRL